MTRTQKVSQVSTVQELVQECSCLSLGGNEGFSKNGNITLNISGYNEETKRASAFVPIADFKADIDTLKSQGYSEDEILVRGGILITLKDAENSKGKGKGKQAAAAAVPAASGVDPNALAQMIAAAVQTAMGAAVPQGKPGIRRKK